VLKDDEGQLLLSKSSVSKVTEALWAEYEAFAKGDLSELDVEYLWLARCMSPCGGGFLAKRGFWRPGRYAEAARRCS
jgi:hypothetical protein